MPHLASFRKGWESENLARFLLSKFSFVSHPATVSDDIGSDFCTLFQIHVEDGRDYLIPRNSFAIQIKSDDKTIDFSNKWSYLWDLEIPFFVGVVDRQGLKLTIYSGEYLPIFFSHKGPPDKLEIEMCARTALDLEQYYTESDARSFGLKFPKIAEIEATVERQELEAIVDTLSEVCSTTHQNIASRKNAEFIFDIYGEDPPRAVIFAGQRSVQVFRENFLRRLAQVFNNLKWVYQNSQDEFVEDEFRIYEHTYRQLERLYGTLPPYLGGSYYALKALLESGLDLAHLANHGEGSVSTMLDPVGASLLKLYIELPLEKRSQLLSEACRLAESESAVSHRR